MKKKGGIVIICISIVFFCFQSCSKKDPIENVDKIVINCSKKNNLNKPLTTTYFKTRKVVSLETTKESLISQIDRLIVFEKRYYIKDGQKSVLIFDNTGKFIKRIKYSGKGPGQYLQLTDFTIDRLKRQIVFLCDIPNRLIFFDLNGNFIKEENKNEYEHYISTNDSSIIYARYLESNGNYIKILRTDKTKQYMSVEEEIIGKDYYSRRPNLIRSNYGVYFFKTYDNIVYKVTNSGITPKYQFDFGNYTFPIDYIKNKSRDEISDFELDNNLASIIHDFRESEKYLTFSVWPYGKIIFFNKENNICHLFSRLYDPEIGLYLHDLIGYDGFGEQVVFQLSSHIFINNIENFENSNLSESIGYNESRELANKLTPNDNPLFIIYDFK